VASGERTAATATTKVRRWCSVARQAHESGKNRTRSLWRNAILSCGVHLCRRRRNIIVTSSRIPIYNIIYHINNNNNNNKKNTCNLARGVRKTRYLVQTMLVRPYIYDPRAGWRIPTMTAARKSPWVRVCVCLRCSVAIALGFSELKIRLQSMGLWERG